METDTEKELRMFLKIKGIFITQLELNHATSIIEERSTKHNSYNKTVHFPWLEGGQNSDDVALVWILADRVKAKEGFDWGWGLEHDNCHYCIGYHLTEEGKKLYDAVCDYREAVLKALYTMNGEKDVVVNSVRATVKNFFFNSSFL